MRKTRLRTLRFTRLLHFLLVCVLVTICTAFIASRSKVVPPSTPPSLSHDRAILSLCRHKPHPGTGRVAASPRARYDAIPSRDGSHTVKARFICTQTNANRMLYDFVATARLAGVPVEVIGLGWNSFSPIDRQWFLVDYADAENLSDDDVVVHLDSDMLFTGEDLYPAIAEFVEKSPASANKTDPLLVRQNNQTAPVLFSTENNCKRYHFTEDAECMADYDDLDSLYTTWSKTSHKESFVPNKDGERNSQRFLNCGFVMGRVWALRLLRNAYSTYVHDNNPPDGSPQWISDQGIYAWFYLNLSRWEVESGLLGRNARLGKRGPLGMVGGMIGLDYQQKYTGAYHGGNVGLLRYGSVDFPEDMPAKYMEHLSPLKADLISRLHNGTLRYGTSAAGAAVAQESLSYRPANTSNTLVGSEHWGAPVIDGTTPPLWHFCGPEKTTKLPAFGSLLPSLIVLDAFPSEEEVSSRIFWSSEPIRVWSVVPAPSRPFMPVTIMRNETADITSEDLCRLR